MERYTVYHVYTYITYIDGKISYHDLLCLSNSGKNSLPFLLEFVVVSTRHFSCIDQVRQRLAHQQIEIDHYLRLRLPFKSFQKAQLTKW